MPWRARDHYRSFGPPWARYTGASRTPQKLGQTAVGSFRMPPRLAGIIGVPHEGSARIIDPRRSPADAHVHDPRSGRMLLRSLAQVVALATLGTLGGCDRPPEPAPPSRTVLKDELVVLVRPGPATFHAGMGGEV